MPNMENRGERQGRSNLGVTKEFAAGLNGLTGACKHLLEEHGGVFASVKRLGSSSNVPPSVHGELLSQLRVEIAAVQTFLRKIAKTHELSLATAQASELRDAILALDAMNPESPEWGPTFVQVGELVEAHMNGDDVHGEGRASSPSWSSAVATPYRQSESVR